MKLVLSGLLIFVNLFTLQSLDENCNVIYWDKKSNLEFTDFKFINNDAVPTETTVAQSDVTVKNYVEFKGDSILVQVRAEFCKNSDSFIYRDFYDHKETLMHEQIHFDICEFWARKLRKIYQTKYKSTQEFYDNYDIEYFKILDSIQVYHKLIDYNYWYEDTKVRNLWIKNKIKEFNEYSNPMITLCFKSK